MNPDGTPIWYELMTPDADGAQAFYADVAGWTIASAGMPGTDYRILTAPDGQAVGGMMTRPAEAPVGPGWIVYLGTADVDATVARVRELGGGVDMEPQDIPGIGRFALVSDPQGMSFYVMRGNDPEPSRAFAPPEIGHAAWNELVVPDDRAAIAFYGALFGWRNDETMSMGEMGDYRFVDLGDRRLGAVMASRGGWGPRWTFYFVVPSIEAAKERIEAAGGTVTQGPHQIPGGGWIILGTDPQGCAFALTGQK